MRVVGPAVADPVTFRRGAVQQDVVRVGFAQGTQQAGHAVGEQVDDGCRVGVAVPAQMPKPTASWARVSCLRRCTKGRRAHAGGNQRGSCASHISRHASSVDAPTSAPVNGPEDEDLDRASIDWRRVEEDVRLVDRRSETAVFRCPSIMRCVESPCVPQADT